MAKDSACKEIAPANRLVQKPKKAKQRVPANCKFRWGKIPPLAPGDVLEEGIPKPEKPGKNRGKGKKAKLPAKASGGKTTSGEKRGMGKPDSHWKLVTRNGTKVWAPMGGKLERVKCGILGAGMKNRPIRSDADAWEIVRDNEPLVYSTMYREGLLPAPRGSVATNEEIRCLGLDAAFMAALTFDENKGTLSTHLDSTIKRLYPVFGEIIGPIAIFPKNVHSDVLKYGRWLSKNPHGTPGEYANEHKISEKGANGLCRAYHEYCAATRPVSTHGLFNGILSGEDLNNSTSSEGHPRWGGIFPEESMAVCRRSPFPDQLEAASSNEWENLRRMVWEIIDMEIHSKDDILKKILLMYFRDGRTLKEIGDRLGFSAERVRQLKEEALDQLIMCEYSMELEDLFEAIRE